MLAMLIPGGICNNSPSALQVLGFVWTVVVWLLRSSWSPRALPNDTSERFSFRVKGGLVIEVFLGLPEQWP